jgi:hypothetical protein
MILDDLFSNRMSKFNESELDRLCETSGVVFIDNRTSTKPKLIEAK